MMAAGHGPHLPSGAADRSTSLFRIVDGTHRRKRDVVLSARILPAVWQVGQ